MHLLCVAGHDTYKLSTVVFQTFQQRVYCFHSKRIIVVGFQSVSLIDKQHATNGPIYQLVCLDGCLSAETGHQFASVGLDKLSSLHHAQHMQHLCHDSGHRGLSRTRISSEYIMLSLELVRLSPLYLEIDECGQIGDFLFHGIQTHHAIQFLQALLIVHRLRCFIRNVFRQDGHKLLVGQILRSMTLQTFRLFFAYLVEEGAYGSAVCKVLVSRVIHFLNHLAQEGLSFGRDDVFLFLGKRAQYLIEFLWLVVFDVQEVVETAAESRVNPEQVVHLHEIACGNDDKFSSVVLHSLHKFLQSLCAQIVALATGTDGSQGVCLVHKQDASHGLVAQPIHHLRRFSLILAHHLCPVHLYHMPAVQVADRGQYLT